MILIIDRPTTGETYGAHRRLFLWSSNNHSKIHCIFFLGSSNLGIRVEVLDHAAEKPPEVEV